jgi:uncharacterized protein YjiS (DUF1127 family)
MAATPREEDMRTMNEARAIPVFEDTGEAGEKLLQDVRPFGTAAGARAVNDAPYDTRAIVVDMGAWTRHATGANGFGDADEVSLAATYDVYHRARESRAEFVAGLVARFARRTTEALRGLAKRISRRRQAADTRAALDELDDRTLRDLGFHRTEIGSIAAEASGDAERTRARFLTSAADAMGARSFQ